MKGTLKAAQLDLLMTVKNISTQIKLHNLQVMFLILHAPYPHSCEEKCLVMNEVFLLARYSSFSTETRKVKRCTHICHERLELVEGRRELISLDHNETIDSRYFSHS